MPGRKKDRYRPPTRKPKGPATDTPAPVIPRTTVSIDRHAGAGRSGLSVGDRVRIIGSGLYAGEIAVVERMTGSVVPAALVRTEAGRTRQVRTIDLEPLAEARPRNGEAAAASPDGPVDVEGDAPMAIAAEPPSAASAPEGAA